MSNDDGSQLQTLSEEELARTLEMSAATFAQLARTVVHDPNSTIEPARLRSSGAGKRALEGLDGGGAEPGITAGLVMGATIGEGGMGVVRAATQTSLGRRVAVKTLRPQVKNEHATLRLLREAWVTGSLEHPNIVPVYDLGLDDDGTPVIVLKHIEGLAWSDIIADAAAVEARFGADDLFEHNLRILVQLCNAVSLAHSRGIVHRDLKPENVMVGRFGEVYLVDWGIAVSLLEDPTGRLPLATEATEMAGTPSYMAPEMLGTGKLGPHTDVYLLGAILHEILVGRPPHVGDNFKQILTSILLSQLTFPEHVPAPLADIARRAMARAPSDRFASADELRQKLEWYLRHRGSLALSAEASLRVEEMRAVLAARGEPDDVRSRVNHLFAEARFGYRQAIRACDDNEGARVGLREATGMVVVFELEEGTPEAAAAALAELETPPPELARRVADAMRRREQEKARVATLEKLSADLDPATGRRTRMVAGAILGLLWTIAPEMSGWLFRKQGATTTRWMPYLFTLGIIVVAAAIVVWGRDSLSKTAVNRRAQAIAMVMFAMQLTLQVGGNVVGLSFLHIFVLHLYCWFFSAAVFALVVDRRFWPSAAGFFVAFVGACVSPEHVWELMSAANALLTINLLFAWSRPIEDSGFLVDRLRERREQRERRSNRGHGAGPPPTS